VYPDKQKLQKLFVSQEIQLVGVQLTQASPYEEGTNPLAVVH